MPIEVLVTFSCSNGATERLALAAALGAVQSRANIRLRRLADSAPPAPYGESDENVLRMRREYVTPAEADVLRAQALIFAAPSGFVANAPEWSGYLTLLARLGAQGALQGKLAAVLSDDSPARDALAAAIRQCGLTIPVIETDPILQGRRLVAALTGSVAG